MWANKIVDVTISALAWLVLPLQIVSTFVLGLLVVLTFGLLLIPINLIWWVFMGPLLALSWLWGKAPLIRIPIAILGIPLAVAGDIYVSIMPSMGETKSRVSKLVFCQTWPFSWECLRFWNVKVPKGDEGAEDRYWDFMHILIELAARDPLIHEYLNEWSEAHPAEELESPPDAA